MERRDLLRMVPALAALPFVRMKVKGVEVAAAETSKGQFVVFADPQVFNFEVLDEPVSEDHPLANSVWFAVRPRPGQSIDDAIRIYKTE